MEAVEKISVGVIKEKTKSKAVKKEAEGMRVSTREKVCYGVGDIGANLVWTTVASFLTIYCTDVAGIAAGVVGTLMLIARLFDGVSDLFMGVIIDKTNTRWGKLLAAKCASGVGTVLQRISFGKCFCIQVSSESVRPISHI